MANLLIEQLTAQLAVLRRMHFGRSSEKLTVEIAQLELLVEDLKEGETARTAPTPAAAPRVASLAERKQPVRRPLPDHLPREDVVHHPGDTCPCCGGTRLSKLGEDVTEVLERVPARLKVIRLVRVRDDRPGPSAAFPRAALAEPWAAPLAPDLPVDKGRPGPALIASIVTSKYIDGLPLYRQAGIDAARRRRYRPRDLVRLGRPRCLVAETDRRAHRRPCAWPTPAIHTDDTPIGVVAPGRGKTKMGRIWTYVVDERPWAGARPPAALYHYSPDRKGERPARHLAGYRGVIHADGYAGYEALTRASAPPGIVHAAC